MQFLLLATSTLAVAIWSGAIVFQSAVVAPTVFDSLDVHQARRFLRSIFPRFYVLGLVSGAVFLAGVGSLGVLLDWPAVLRWLAALAVVMLGSAALSLWLVPHINAARDKGIAGQQRFRNLHRVSVMLTVLVLLLAAASLVLLVSGNVQPGR